MRDIWSESEETGSRASPPPPQRKRHCADLHAISNIRPSGRKPGQTYCRKYRKELEEFLQYIDRERLEPHSRWCSFEVRRVSGDGAHNRGFHFFFFCAIDMYTVHVFEKKIAPLVQVPGSPSTGPSVRI